MVQSQLAELLAQASIDSPRAAFCTEAAGIVAGLNLGRDAILAAGLYPLWDHELLPTPALMNDMPEVRKLLEGISRLKVIDELSADVTGQAASAIQVERLRKMLLAMVEDARVMVIKLIYRVLELQQAKPFEEERRRLARQTLDIYAPLANRLGMGHIKWQLEDLSLRYLDPEKYHKIAHWLDERRIDREQYIEEAIAQLKLELSRHRIEAEVTGRPKHIYSIWRKLERKGTGFDSLFDVRAVRVLVKDIPTCYATLGIIHGRWHPIPGQFDDYIAAPKENNYQSLHTAVIGPRGKTLEVQIRTREMHEHAEFGIAAHWRYKEGEQAEMADERRINWLRRLLESAAQEQDSEAFLDQFTTDIEDERIYVITPQGDIVDLPQGATALDFAYTIHTDIGHRCRGARINNVLVPLTQTLHTGDRVEILTAREPKPSRDWLLPQLGYLTTNRARAKVKQWFKQKDYEQNVVSGRQLIERELHRLNILNQDLQALTKRFGYNKLEDFLAAVGGGDLNTAQIVGRLQQPAPTAEPRLKPMPGKEEAASNQAGIQIQGIGQLMSALAQCCRPVPPDSIMGYITRGRGITIHRRDCANLLRLEQEAPARVVPVDWGQRAWAQTYPATIRVEAYDRHGLLRDITTVLAEQKVNVMGANTDTDPETGIATMDLRIQITDISQLSHVLNRISRLPHIMSARRLK